MKICAVDFEIRHGGVSAYHTTLRIPEYTRAEWDGLYAAWHETFPNYRVPVLTLGLPELAYDFIENYTGIPYSSTPYYNVKPSSTQNVEAMARRFFPIFDTRNLYDIFDAITPDSEGTYYRNYTVSIYSNGQLMGEGTGTIGIPKREYVGQGYGTIFTIGGYPEGGNSPAVTCLWKEYGDERCRMRMWCRVVDNDSVYLKSYTIEFSNQNTAYVEYLFTQFPTGFSAPDEYDQNGFLSAYGGGAPSFDPYDPYSQGGNSDEYGGGDGNFDGSSDTINDSSLPTISAANTGFTRIYNPTLAQVQSLANYLWTDSTIIQTLWNHVKQFLENPMDAFIAFNLLPCVVPDGGTVEFKVMYIGTGVNMTAAASQFVDVDCGDLVVDKYYDSALDYSPYTKISIFLPFIGSVQLDTDDVMGKTISVKYRIDIVSGGCVAKIFVDGSVHYQYSGHCAITIPFTSADFTGYISAMIQTAKSVTSIAAGAAGNTQLASSLAGMPEQRTGKSTTTETVSARNPDTGRLRNVARTVTEKESVNGTEASFGSLVANNFNNTVGTVMGSKAIVDRSGAFSGNTGYLGVRRPFVVIERPRMCNPSEYGKLNGRPSMLTLTLGECFGFTQVQQVQLTGFSATNPELDEIGSLLKSGVVF